MPMSDTPKKIEFMIMKDSARLLVMASKVAFIDSDESYTETISTERRANDDKCVTYYSLFLDNIDRRVDIVLVR
jgi:hypothetical protein